MTRVTEKCPLSVLTNVCIKRLILERIEELFLDKWNCQLCMGVCRVGLNCILTVSHLQCIHTWSFTTGNNSGRIIIKFSYYDLLYRLCCMCSFLLPCLRFSICLNPMRNSCHKKRFEHTFYSHPTLSFDMLEQGLVPFKS